MTRIFGILFMLCLFLGTDLIAQEEVDLNAGKTLFKNNCASCHNKNMRDDLTGPALGGYEERWADYSQEELYRWIRNSQAMINEGHPKAVELWDEWKPTVMTAFPNLTDQDIANILAYVEGVYEGTYPPKKEGEAAGAAAAQEDQGLSAWVYWAIFGILAFLALLLSRVLANLNRLRRIAEGGEDEPVPSVWSALTNKSVISFIIFALIVIGGYYTVNNAIAFGRQQGYAPEQPIKFSHEIHAGLHKIDCQYCHDGARRSKHAVIPATNTCMNCHRAIKKGSLDGTAELTKIFVSVGYDPNEDTYIEDYDNMAQDSIAEIYKKWISDEYVKDAGLNAIDQEGINLVEDQWSDIVESLTNDHKPNVQGPIEWVRIHNLPDHVYFNHAQHVTVGELECQTCHGQVEEMEVMAQYAPLSMGWCINCHRQTEVQFASNEYYDSYEKYHEALANDEKDNVTVEDIGGLECQKCHY
ncbi:MAG: c-type cytochrome [Saprospiraceae bacterium]|nr:c-type cytochrome [Saprospiraceae bacterium]